MTYESVEAIVFHGYEGNDTFVNSTSIAATAYGNGGHDTLVGGFADGVLKGGDDNDYLVGRAGNGSLHGNDNLAGQDGDDSLYGWYGDDIMKGHEGSDMLCGGDDDDSYVRIDKYDQGYDPDQELESEKRTHEDKRMEKESWELYKMEFYQLRKAAKQAAQTVEKNGNRAHGRSFLSSVTFRV